VPTCRTGVAALGIVWIITGSPAADAGTVVLPAQLDATLIESATGSLANGAGPAFFAGRTSQARDSIRRAALAFDVTGRVPRGVRISAVSLVLALSPSHDEAATVHLHRIVSPWTEGPSSASGGSGAPPQPGDATWLHGSYPALPWAAPGGDFVAAPSAGTEVVGPGLYQWGSTPELVADVQRWLDEPSSNHGWLLVGNEQAPSTAKRFESRESAEVALRPVLLIEFGASASPCSAVDLEGAASGLCQVYCEALDCDTDDSAPACALVAARFAVATGGGEPPCVLDADGDGVPDEADNCFAHPNEDQRDGDGDGVGDACDNCAAVANADQADSFGTVGIGDACDCPCFTPLDSVLLAETLQDGAVYTDLVCIDTRVNAKPLTALSAVRVDGAPCSLASADCSLLAVEFTEDRACQWNPPAPAAETSVQGISDAQREACRIHILTGAEATGLVCN
jgi:hypothetical protein